MKFHWRHAMQLHLLSAIVVEVVEIDVTIYCLDQFLSASKSAKIIYLGCQNSQETLQWSVVNGDYGLFLRKPSDLLQIGDVLNDDAPGDGVQRKNILDHLRGSIVTVDID